MPIMKSVVRHSLLGTVSLLSLFIMGGCVTTNTITVKNDGTPSVNSTRTSATTSVESKPSKSLGKQNSSSSTPTTQAKDQTQPASSEAEANTTSQSDLYIVTKVVDGDTIDVTKDGKTIRVRYIGMDTPETVHPTKDVQCFGKDASGKNKELVLGKQVRLEKDVSETDRYNRSLRYVYVGSTFINLELVKQGYATAATFPPDVKYSKDFVAAEREAREAKRGLWASCKAVGASSEPKTTPTQPVASSPTPIAPTPAQASTPSASCKIKGNINSDKEKIYHLPGCGSYNKTTIDESQGEHWFCTEQEAVQAGWRKALNC